MTTRGQRRFGNQTVTTKLPSGPLRESLDGWNQTLMWALLVVAGLHIVAALVRLIYYRDGVMRRMLPV